jgi:hypothetical protein
MTLALRVNMFIVNLVNILTNVHLLYKPGYIITGVGNLTKEKSCIRTAEPRSLTAQCPNIHKLDYFEL